jgi:response regulator RpfG family c-di-GMP phosphodiesterase
MAPIPANSDTPRPTILCVDDEPSILSSLRRLFRAHGFNVLAAESGQAGLQILETSSVDLVISDMRMPEMDGVVFLEHVRQRWPQILRLLLTGYADISSIMGAINRGEIYRYIAKPWDDNDIILTVKDALTRSELEKEKKRLEALVLAQNEELKQMNASLEVKVEARTSDLRQANDKLKANFITSIKMFTALIELRDSKLAGHSRRVAELARRLAQALHLDAKQVQEIFVAGLLHAIGKVGFDDSLLCTAVATMSPRQLEIFRKHPVRAEQLLMSLGELKSAVEIIRAQLERFDGSGYPQGTAGRHIPIGARILSVAIDYESMQIGVYEPQQLSAAQAMALISQRKGHYYDPVVVEALADIGGLVTSEKTPSGAALELALESHQMRPGMVLSRDLISPSGLLLLTAGHILDGAVIDKIIGFERSLAIRLTAHVHQTATHEKV